MFAVQLTMEPSNQIESQVTKRQ